VCSSLAEALVFALFVHKIVLCRDADGMSHDAYHQIVRRQTRGEYGNWGLNASFLQAVQSKKYYSGLPDVAPYLCMDHFDVFFA
jgi:hypothetical protein